MIRNLEIGNCVLWLFFFVKFQVIFFLMRIFNFKNNTKTKQYKSEKNLKNAKAPLLMTSVVNTVVCCQNLPPRP